VKEGTFRRGAPRGNPSARTQLLPDRQMSHGSKKEETLRRRTEVPEENRKKHHVTVRDLLRI